MEMDFSQIYFDEMEERLNEAIELLKKYLETHDPIIIKDLHRIFHTLKGSAGLVGLNNIQSFMHVLESEFKKRLDNELEEDFVARIMKISAEIVNKKKDLTPDEVKYFSSILEGKEDIDSSSGRVSIDSVHIDYFEKIFEEILKAENLLIQGNKNSALKNLKQLRKSIQKIIEDSKFISLNKVLEDFENLVYQEAVFNKKKVRLELFVEDEKIGKKDAKFLRNILVHLVKNAIAHGIELPEERIKNNKKEYGKITIKSYSKGEFLYIEVTDDGKGIDIEKVKEKAKEKGITYEDPYEIIFESGFSTKETADLSSGRGVGLDSVKAFVESREGFIKVKSTPQKGTTFIVSFKTELTSKKVLIVKRQHEIFAIFSNEIQEVLKDAEIINDEKINYKGKIMDLIDFKEGDFKFIIAGRNKAIAVDEIIGYFETFVLPYEKDYIVGFAKNIFSYPVPIISIEEVNINKKRISNKEKTILVLDDSTLTRFVISKLIRNAGFRVIEAKSGEEAIEKKGYDAAILDVELPGISGYEVARILRNRNKDLPIIMLSTKDSPEDIKKGLDLGINAYLSKSDDPEKIVILLKKFLEV
ncbi:chemotaxis protein histidine kinase-like protein [Marinitoga piezophila KA3]|uniref:histidine kinase n=1 Tax=Marinitoga piezophila (strain DSM 14283 / JCM 11233 / KA3) TaxID=443254 RepID=H2J731_MARPK|nr:MULTISPECIES: response regulator [Marinitoga]AEX86401.1 chemotaxis protein histidine kinase-like protein [Marinitoga piezophila KA3]